VKLVVIPLLLASTIAAADLVVAPVVLEARHPSGALFQLHDASGPCVSPAKLATYTSTDGKYQVNGCAKVNTESGIVGIAWMDGDASTVPVRAFNPPNNL